MKTKEIHIIGDVKITIRKNEVFMSVVDKKCDMSLVTEGFFFSAKDAKELVNILDKSTLLTTETAFVESLEKLNIDDIKKVKKQTVDIMGDIKINPKPWYVPQWLYNKIISIS